MNLTNTLTPVTKNNFYKWHEAGDLLLLGAGNSDVDILLGRLNDTEIHWGNLSRQVMAHGNLSKHDSVFMYSNGCDEFILIINDMQASQYNRDYFTDTNRKHVTAYVVEAVK